MTDYRLEACTACGIVRIKIRGAIADQRERDGTDRAEWFGETPVWRVPFCAPCEQAYSESLQERP